MKRERERERHENSDTDMKRERDKDEKKERKRQRQRWTSATTVFFCGPTVLGLVSSVTFFCNSYITHEMVFELVNDLHL